MAKRLHAMGAPRYANGFKLTLQEDLIDLPRSWRRPKLVFVNSMSDLFQEDVPVEFIRRVFETMAACPQHTFQVLTKRSERLTELASTLPWRNNIWIGVSIENLQVIDRVSHLRKVPAAVRFLSCEPLIGPLDPLPPSGDQHGATRFAKRGTGSTGGTDLPGAGAHRRRAAGKL